jgi:hypothetical protein
MSLLIQTAPEDNEACKEALYLLEASSLSVGEGGNARGAAALDSIGS